MQTVNEEWWEGPEKKRRTAIGPGIESSASSRLCTFRLTSTPVFNTVVAAGWDPELGVVPPTVWGSKMVMARGGGEGGRGRDGEY